MNVATNFLKIVSKINFDEKSKSQQVQCRMSMQQFLIRKISYKIDIYVLIKRRIFRRRAERVTQSKNNALRDKEHLVQTRESETRIITV